MSVRNIYELPPNLPVPEDDGACDHLEGMSVPELTLISTEGDLNLGETFAKPCLLFIYPRAGSPLEPNSNLELWDTIPGARGCTPHSCAFRDAHGDFEKLGVRVLGMSIQSPHVQKEFVERNYISFPILSDHKFQFTEALNLPTFEFEGERLIKRMALYIDQGRVQKVFYPVFPPDKNAETCLEWLKAKK